MMTMELEHNFVDDLRWSCTMRDRYLIHFYRKYSQDGRYVFVDKSKCSTLLQKQLAVDTIVQSKQGGSICIEEKIERWPGYTRTNFALETDSCTVPGREKVGWMSYAEADYLLYAFELPTGGLHVYFIDFQPLRQWFEKVKDNYKSHTMLNTINHTRFKKVPINDVLHNIKTTQYVVTDEGCLLINKLKTSRKVNTNVHLADGIERAKQIKSYIPRVVEHEDDEEESFEDVCEAQAQAEAILEEQEIEWLTIFGEVYERNRKR